MQASQQDQSFPIFGELLNIVELILDGLGVGSSTTGDAFLEAISLGEGYKFLEANHNNSQLR